VPGHFPRRALAAAAVAALLLLALWAGSDRPPRLPADADHAADLPEARCLECHGHTAREPRPADHPPRDDCFSCHKDAAGALHPRRGAPQSVPGGWESDPRLR
jgi:hypothetical protein